jgi:hypothetical protein
LAAARGGLDALGKFPQGTRFGRQLADAALSGCSVPGQLSLGRAAPRQHGDDLAALFRDGGLGVSEDALFGGDDRLVLAGEGERLAVAALFGLVGGGQGAGDDAGAGGAWLDPALCECGGDDGRFVGAAGVALRGARGGNLLLNGGEALASGGGGGFGLLAAAGGFDEARIERAHFALSCVGLRAQPFGALRFRATIAFGLRDRTLRLGFCRPQEER